VKRAALVLAAFLILGLMTPAQANGLCVANSITPTHTSNSVVFSGNINCGTTIHSISVFIDLYRRTPGGTWLWWDPGQADGIARKVTAVSTSPGYNCAKDYRVTTDGFAKDMDGGYIHPINADSGGSRILFHTC
jgi:hypothetical protein